MQDTARLGVALIAIIPAGGKGTRMASVTNGCSKEALPLGSRTVLDLVLDEAFSAGVTRAVVVSAREKSDIEPIVSARTEHVDLRYQDVPLGLAHAIAAAREDMDALVLLPDTVFAGVEPTKRLAALQPMPDAAILTQPVSNNEVNFYGIVEIESDRVNKILEKPKPTETSSRLAVAARYFLSDRVLRLVNEFVQAPSSSGEWDLTTALNRAILHSMTVSIIETGERRYDCGSPEGYREAFEAFGR